jgi:hypothetical protein
MTNSARLCVRFTEAGQSQDIKAILLADYHCMMTGNVGGIYI